jgi:hypothetical protein
MNEQGPEGPTGNVGNPGINELDSLKQTATTMGITFHPNIGLDKLKAKIEAVRSPVALDEEVTIEEEYAGEELETIAVAAAGSRLSTYTPNAKVTAAELKNKRKQDATRLVRIRVTNMNPIKGNIKGEIISAGNAEIGFVKKMIPYNAEQGWHVPNILLTVLRNKKFMSHYEVKIGNRRVKRHRLVPEYAIEVMEPLTGKEIGELKQRQIIAGAGA